MPSSKKKGKQQEEENVHVVVRIRPLSEDEQGQGAEEVMRIGADKRTIQVLLPDDVDFAGSSRQTVKKFSLDGCLPSRTTQEDPSLPRADHAWRRDRRPRKGGLGPSSCCAVATPRRRPLRSA